MNVIKKCLSGFYQILQSLSGTFSLLTLIIIGIVTYKAPAIGGIALAAFATAVPSILAYCEHKETLQQVAQTVVVNNLPPNGQL